MYVCICNAIRDSEVRDLAHRGVRSAEGIYEALGCEPHCASCTEELQDMLDRVADAVGAASAA